MKKPICALAGLALMLVTALAAQQLPASTSAAAEAVAAPDHSREPAVIERLTTRYRFENDGTGVRETEAAIRIQSQGGVEAFGQQLFPYNSSSERLEVTSMRVVHADGTAAEGASAVQSLPAPVTTQFPLYSDLHFLHVTAPAIEPGDRLEYSLRAEIVKPLAPGHFWIDHLFTSYPPTLDEVVYLDVPTGREITFHGTGVEEVATAEAGRRVRGWRRSRQEALGGDDETPTLRASTFTSWNQVAAWYSELQRGRLAATPEIRSKVEELTAGLDDPVEIVRALYHHVSQQYRYLSLSFGIGAYQPHQASAVFSAGYGDCKDKHTLLAAMLEAAGFAARPVLISTTEDLVEGVPSPGQFDHMITAIPRGAVSGEEGWIWLDSTPAVAPFGYLHASIRDRRALVVAGDALGEVVTTPAELPYPDESLIEIRGELSPLGRLTARVTERFRGDDAVGLGGAFLASSEEQRVKLIETLVEEVHDLEGEIGGIQISDPLAVGSPLELTFSLDRPDAWKVEGSARHFSVPQPNLLLPEVAEVEDSADPLELKGPFTDVYRFAVELPEGFSATAPIPVSLERPFATYRSTYEIDGATLHVQRIFEARTTEIPREDFSAWSAFRRAVEADVDQFFRLSSAGVANIAELTDVAELFAAGKAARQDKQHDEAIRLLKRAAELDPSHLEVRFELGHALAGKKEWTAAEAVFRETAKLDPFHHSVHEYLAWVLEKQDRDDEAISAYQAQLEVNPLRHYSNRRLGELLVEAERYEEAIVHLTRADSIEPGSPRTLQPLLIALLSAGREAEAREASRRLLAASPGASDLRDAAGVAWDVDSQPLALELYLAMAQEDSSAAWVWSRIGTLHGKTGELPAAADAFEKALELEPDEPEHLFGLGVVRLHQADYQEAISLFEQAHDRAPADERVIEYLSALYQETGQLEKLAALLGEGR